MRNYWLRIGFSALGIFAIGMLIWTLAQKGKHAVEEMVEGDGPITIPLALLPFSVDGRSLGTLRRLEIIRSTPEKVKAVNFQVRLADSIADGRLADCVLVVGGSLKKLDAEHVFNCVPAADTVGARLAPIGDVQTQRGMTYVLFAPEGALDSVSLEFRNNQATSDSARDAAEAFADSIRDAQEARADSIRETASAKADSIQAAAEAMSDSIQRHVDSVINARMNPPAKQGRVEVTAPPRPPTPPKR